MNRRKFVKNLLKLGAVGGIALTYAWQIEPFWLEFVKVKMPIKNLPDHLVGKTVMQISDMHIGDRFDYRFISDSFKKAQQFAPDFVVYTGDFVSYKTPEQLKQLAEVFEHIVVGKLGTVGVLGNHDYGKNWAENDVADAIVQILADKGLPILRNESKEIDGLNFIGLDDFWGTNYNPEAIMAQIDDKKAQIVLCHNPDVADKPIWGHYDSWILAGHTHGGQCKPPFLDAPMLPVKNKRYTAGQFDVGGGRTLYINRALGNLWQVRFNVRPEITLFELGRV